MLYDLVPPKRYGALRDRGNDFMLSRVKTERFKLAFVNRCLPLPLPLPLRLPNCRRLSFPGDTKKNARVVCQLVMSEFQYETEEFYFPEDNVCLMT